MVLETVGSSKSNNIRYLLIKAWRERWTDLQWGIHIKTVLPRYISGDIYHLSDCILQQALMGPLPNQLIISYLRHSLAAHIVSYGGVIETISKYDSLHKAHCVRALLDLLSDMVEKVTCRGKPEDCLTLASALVAGVKWLLKVILYASKETTSFDHAANLKTAIELLHQYMHSQFLMSLMRIACLEDSTLWDQAISFTKELETKIATMDVYPVLRDTIPRIIELRNSTPVKCSNTIHEYDPSINPICYGLHARVLVEALVHSGQSTQYLGHQLFLYKQLRNMSETNLYLELLSSCFLGLGSDEKFPHQQFHWVGFTFMKVPAVIKLIHTNIHGMQGSSEAVLSAIKQLALRTSLLDAVDANMNCNCLEILLGELKTHLGFLTDADLTSVLKLRLEDPMAVCIGPVAGKEGISNSSVIPNLIINARPTVDKILKSPITKDSFTLMNLLVSGKSRDMLLTAAAASGKLLSYAQKFMKINQQSLEPQPGETETMATNRALMFDITFLLLCYMTQVYGVEVVSGEDEDTFIEKWMRKHIPDKSQSKIEIPQPFTDPALLSEIRKQICGQDLNSKYSKVHWSKVCSSASTMMKNLKSDVLLGTISIPAALELLDKACGHMCALPICFTSWICSTIDDNSDKMNSILDHLQWNICSQEPSMALNYFKDRSQLMRTIICNMVKITRERYDICSTKDSNESNFFGSLISSYQIPTTVSDACLKEANNDDLMKVFHETWNDVYQQSGILNHSGLLSFQKVLRLGGFEMFVHTLMNFAMTYVFEADLNKAMDLIYGIFQIDVHKCCVHLFTSCLPKYLTEPDCSHLHSYQRIIALSKLSVQVLVAAWASASVVNNSQPFSNVNPPFNSRKRSYSVMTDAALEEELLKKITSISVDQNSLKSLNEKSVALMVAVQQFFNSMQCEAVPKGVINPVNEFIVCLLQQMVCAPSILSPLLSLLPSNMISSFLTLFPSDTFTPSQLLGLALPSLSHTLKSPMTLSQQTTARRYAAKLLCIHRNLMLADAVIEEDDEMLLQ